MVNLRNPKEFFSIVEDKTFFVLNELSTPSCQDGSEPLTMYDSRFSRFKFAIINAEKKAATANIPALAMPGIFYKMEGAIFEDRIAKMMKRFNPHSDDAGNSPAYTVQLTSGSFRGKTPAQVLLEKPENRSMLESQMNWLKQNLGKYPKNQIQIDAISAAMDLLKTGNLRQSASPTQSVVSLYSSGMRPLVRRKREDGMCFVYEISIGFNAGTERPVGIEIRNYFAPVVKRDNGLLNVLKKEMDKSSEVKNVFWMSMDNWLWFRHLTEAQMRTFENMYAPSLYKTAFEAEAANRAAFGAMTR